MTIPFSWTFRGTYAISAPPPPSATIPKLFIRTGGKGLREKKYQNPKLVESNNYHQSSSRAFQWMVMSVGFDNLKFWGNFCIPLGDRSHHQSLRINEPASNTYSTHCVNLSTSAITKRGVGLRKWQIQSELTRSGYCLHTLLTERGGRSNSSVLNSSFWMTCTASVILRALLVVPFAAWNQWWTSIISQVHSAKLSRGFVMCVIQNNHGLEMKIFWLKML
jgi:hypothetical protein